jgi:hypothetical protein
MGLAGKASAGTLALPGLIRRRGILFRTAMFSWMVTILAVVAFVLFLLPYQKGILIERMESGAEVIATSIAQVTIASIVVEDYSTVSEHCLKVVEERPMVLYLVITRKDGFSLVNRADGWSSQFLDGYWRPKEHSQSGGTFSDSDLVDERVYHYTDGF